MPNPFPNKDKKQLLMTLLKLMGGSTVVVSFSGGGDSGTIDSVGLHDAKGEPISLENTMFIWEIETEHHEDGKWVKQYTTKAMPIADILTQITYDALENTQLDWYNNEGGQGELEIDLNADPPKVILQVGINYTHTDEHKFYLQEEEEENAPTSP